LLKFACALLVALSLLSGCAGGGGAGGGGEAIAFPYGETYIGMFTYEYREGGYVATGGI